MVYRSLVWWLGRCSFAGLRGSMDDEDKLNPNSERRPRRSAARQNIPCSLLRGSSLTNQYRGEK